jgi:hypothetical protein
MTGKLLKVQSVGKANKQEISMSDPNLFRDYFAAANAQEGLSEREKMFIGLAVTMTKTCEP